MTFLKYKIKDLDFFLQLIIYNYLLPSINNKLKKDIYNFYVLKNVIGLFNPKKLDIVYQISLKYGIAYSN
jgi:hypothetical protein